MGSTGTGRLSDYTGYSGAEKGKTGGKDIEDQCERAVYTTLEDVETSEYFTKKKKVPDKGTPVKVKYKNPRLVAIDEDGTVIGNLPTEYNYLVTCISSGYEYKGEVSGSFMEPLPSVDIAVTPRK